MDRKPRVSVIVSIWNGERFLVEAIESVFAQTFKDWELLLVDDGSSDASAAIAQGYSVKYPQAIRYLEHPNHRRRGQGASRNLGVRNAAGDYIATLDQDDFWLPNKLERQVAILDTQSEAALVYGASLYWHNWAGEGTSREADSIQLPGVPANRVYIPPILLKLTLSEQIIPPIPTDFMFRKECICKLGCFEESFIGALSMFEDQAFLVKVYASFPVFVSDECWDRYRIHPAQHCAKIIHAGKKPRTENFFLSWVTEYLEIQGAMDAELNEILRRRMWPHKHPILRYLKRAINAGDPGQR